MKRPAIVPDATKHRARWAWVGVWGGLTLLLLLLRPGYTFPAARGLDGWIYTSYQWDLRGQIADFGPTYYGSRLSWILPGALFQALLPAAFANVALKLTVSAFFAAACASLVRRAGGSGAALLAAALAVLSPQFISALHSDYTDIPVIVYAALALACITAARENPRWPLLIFAGGCFFAGMVIANLSALASVGLGIAVYHLAWLRWGVRRHLTAIGLYLSAAAFVCVVAGLAHRAAGGAFFFLKPQWEMLLYMGRLKDNPWMPHDRWWFTEASWLLLPVGTLLWGLSASLLTPPAEGSRRQQIRSLTAALAASLGLAAVMQARALDATLSVAYYASFHLCFALPLLALLVPTAASSRKLPGAILLLLLAVLFWPQAPVALALAGYLPFRHSFPAVPFAIAAGLLLAAAGLTLLSRRWPRSLLARFASPELLLLGLFICSIPLEFHDAILSYRLRERYLAINTAYRTLAREFPRGSYRFWAYPEKREATSLASTKLWEYRLFSLKPFPLFEPANLITWTEDQTLIVPGPPGHGPAILAAARRVLAQAGYTVAHPRVFSVPDESVGFDLVSFSLEQHALDPEQPGKAAARDSRLLLDLTWPAGSPRIAALAYNLYGPNPAAAIDVSRGYAIFTRTDPRDHLATEYLPLPLPAGRNARQIILVATMPADGDCIAFIQSEDGNIAGEIALKDHGRSVHSVSLSPGTNRIRLYMQSRGTEPTALPTRVALYELAE